MVTYRVEGIALCWHCDQPPRVTVTNCNNCRVYWHKVDSRVKAEYEAEAKSKS
jgi:hypothetical protein